MVIGKMVTNEILMPNCFAVKIIKRTWQASDMHYKITLFNNRIDSKIIPKK